MIVKDINEWCFKNLDLIQECLEKNNKSIILIAGASSSGKSHCSQILKDFLEKRNFNCLVLSTDSYNVGISGIVTNKVNEKYFDGKLENIFEIKQIIKNTIINSTFDEKFSKNNQKTLNSLLNLYLGEDTEKFIGYLVDEFNNINFDETSVYDLKQVASDLKELLNDEIIYEKVYDKSISERQLGDKISGKEIDIILVEGIFALNDLLTDNLKDLPVIKNFVESDSKTLFLRRIIRDNKITTASSVFTVKAYFEKVIPSYKLDILPTKNKADLIIQNNMTFEELRTGEIYSSQVKKEIMDYSIIEKLKNNAESEKTIIQKDIYLKSEQELNSFDNLLRIRLIKKDNEFELFSLVHKGIPKFRKDNKLIRPINILINDGDLTKVASNEKELLSLFESIGLKVDKIIEKERTKLYSNNIEYTIDKLYNDKIFIEVTSNSSSDSKNLFNEKISFDLIETL